MPTRCCRARAMSPCLQNLTYSRKGWWSLLFAQCVSRNLKLSYMPFGRAAQYKMCGAIVQESYKKKWSWRVLLRNYWPIYLQSWIKMRLMSLQQQFIKYEKEGTTWFLTTSFGTQGKVAEATVQAVSDFKEANVMPAGDQARIRQSVSIQRAPPVNVYKAN